MGGVSELNVKVESEVSDNDDSVPFLRLWKDQRESGGLHADFGPLNQAQVHQQLLELLRSGKALFASESEHTGEEIPSETHALGECNDSPEDHPFAFSSEHPGNYDCSNLIRTHLSL